MSGTALFICHGKVHRKPNVASQFETVAYLDTNTDKDPDYTTFDAIPVRTKYDSIFSVGCPANTGAGINAWVIFDQRVLLHLKMKPAGKYFVNNLFTFPEELIAMEAAKHGFIFTGFVENVIDDRADRLIATFMRAPRMKS